LFQKNTYLQIPSIPKGNLGRKEGIILIGLKNLTAVLSLSKQFKNLETTPLSKDTRSKGTKKQPSDYVFDEEDSNCEDLPKTPTTPVKKRKKNI